MNKFISAEFDRFRYHFTDYLVLWGVIIMSVALLDVLPVWFDAWPRYILVLMFLFVFTRLFDPMSDGVCLAKGDLLDMRKVLKSMYALTVCQFVFLLPFEGALAAILFMACGIPSDALPYLLSVYCGQSLLFMAIGHFLRQTVLTQHLISGLLLACGMMIPGVFLYAAFLDSLIRGSMNAIHVGVLLAWQISLAGLFPFISFLVSVHLTE